MIVAEMAFPISIPSTSSQLGLAAIAKAVTQFSAGSETRSKLFQLNSVRFAFSKL